MIRTVTRQFRFEAAHRLLGHKGKCARLHGHSYVATVVLSGRGLDEHGMLVDFGDMKDTIGKWIDKNWDHSTILSNKDPLLYTDTSNEELFGHNPYAMGDKNPTAENMAEELVRVVNALMKGGGFLEINLQSVTIRETESCSATISMDPIERTEGWNNL